MKRDDRYKEIQLVQLRSFCAAAARGNFTAAARAVGLSASTVWEQVRALERKLGVTLLRQQGRAVEMTPEGRLLLEMVQPHVQGLDGLERAFEARRGDLPGRLTVASSQYLLHGHLTGPLQQFTAARPAVRVSVLLPDAQAVAPAVERGEADLAVFPYDREDRRNPVLGYEDLFELPLVVLTAARHPLARRKGLALADLEPYPVILPGRESFTRRVIDRVLQRLDLRDRLHVVMETSVHDTIQRYAALGVGVGLIHMVPRASPGLSARTPAPAPEGLPVALIARKYADPPGPVREFRELTRRLLAAPG